MCFIPCTAPSLKQREGRLECVEMSSDSMVTPRTKGDGAICVERC